MFDVRNENEYMKVAERPNLDLPKENVRSAKNSSSQIQKAQ